MMLCFQLEWNSVSNSVSPTKAIDYHKSIQSQLELFPLDGHWKPRSESTLIKVHCVSG
jgi:hypothetical protein